MTAASAAKHSGPLDEAFGEALAIFAEEAELILERINFDRFLAGKR